MSLDRASVVQVFKTQEKWGSNKQPSLHVIITNFLLLFARKVP